MLYGVKPRHDLMVEARLPALFLKKVTRDS